MRNAGPLIALLLTLGLFGGFAWLTQNPETPWLETAQDWPLIGDLATRFRIAYLGRTARGLRDPAAESTSPPPAVAPAARVAAAPKVAERSAPPPEPSTDRPASQPTHAHPGVAPAEPAADSRQRTSDLNRLTDVESAMTVESVIRQIPGTGIDRAARRKRAEPPLELDDWIWILPGNTIRDDSEPGAEIQERFRSMAFLPVLGRREPWVQVTFRGRQGWIDTSWNPPFQRRKATRGILRHRYEPVRASDSRKLKQVRKILGIERPAAKLGAYTLYTDVDDEDLLAFLDRAAAVAEDAYFARYGRLPSGDPKRSAVLFAREADYREFSQLSRGLPGNQVGHAGSGILSFFAEGRSRQALARTLVHEIGHLLNRRALAAFLPPWIEEGIASDLGAAWVEGSPTTEPRRGVLAWAFDLQTPDHSLLRLASTHENGSLPSVAILMHLDREKFHSSPAYAYAHSAAFVRFLADSEAGREGEAFRLFLKRIAAGRGAEPNLLLKLLETDFETLDRDFRAWLVAEAEAIEDRLASG